MERVFQRSTPSTEVKNVPLLSAKGADHQMLLLEELRGEEYYLKRDAEWNVSSQIAPGTPGCDDREGTRRWMSSSHIHPSWDSDMEIK